MQNIVAILKGMGIEVPEERTAELTGKVAENYVTRAEFDKKMGRAETERDAYRERAEKAETTLKGFEGLEPEKVKSEIETYKKAAEDAAKDYERRIYERDFADALNAEVGGIKFTSEAAKKAVTEEIKAAGLTLKDGKILGFSDLVGQIKERDATAFVDEAAEKAKEGAARFTVPAGMQNTAGTMTKEKFRTMTLDERMKLRQSNPEAYEELRRGKING